MRRLRPVELPFADDAPVRLIFAARMTASPEAVHRALAEDVTDWPRWFGAVALARPTHEGRGREVRLRGGVRFLETVLVSDAPERYAYRVDRTNAPGLRALLEDWRLSPDGSGGTWVRWTWAVGCSPAVRPLVRAARPGLSRAFRGAVGSLDRRLAAPGPS